MVKKKIAFVLAVFCATVLLMAVQKPVFLAYYAADAAQASVGEWLGVVWPLCRCGCGCPGEYGGGC